MMYNSPTSIYDPYGLSSSVVYTPSTTMSTLTPFSPFSPNYSPLSPYVQINTPIVTKYSDDALLDSPLLASLNLSFSEPVFGVYQNLNADPELHEKMVDHFYYYKTLGDWLYDELSGLLDYLEIDKNGDIKLISSEDKYKKDSIDSDSEKVIEKKIEYLKKNVFTKKDMMYLLTNIVHDTNTNWYDLPHKENKVIKNERRYIEKKLLKMIKKHK